MLITNIGSLHNSSIIRENLRTLASNGKLWFAVGRGLDTWDSSPSTPSKSKTKLENEVYRVNINSEDIVYVSEILSEVEEQEDVVSENPTDTIRILGKVSYPYTPLREYGIFITNTNVSSKDDGDLYLYGTNPKIVLSQLNLYMKYMYIQNNM